MRTDIIAEARRQLAATGAVGLSLIVEGYDAMGEVAEAAAKPAGTPRERFRAVCGALRGWA